MAEASFGATGNAAQSILNDQLLVAAGMGDLAALREALAAGADVEDDREWRHQDATRSGRQSTHVHI